MNLAWNIMTTFNGWQLRRALNMGMHASLIWPFVIVLALLGPGWNAWPSQDSPTSPGRFGRHRGRDSRPAPNAVRRAPTGPPPSRTAEPRTQRQKTSREQGLQIPRPLPRPGRGGAISFQPMRGPESGTMAHPFGLIDLLNPDHSPGKALTVLRPGDTLFFRKGDYHLTGDTGNVLEDSAAEPLGFRHRVPAHNPRRLIPERRFASLRMAEDRPVFGTFTPTLNYIRFIGFIVGPECRRFPHSWNWERGGLLRSHRALRQDNGQP